MPETSYIKVVAKHWHSPIRNVFPPALPQFYSSQEPVPMRLPIPAATLLFLLSFAGADGLFAQPTSLYREDFRTNQTLRYSFGSFDVSNNPSAVSFSSSGVTTNIPASSDSFGGLGVDPTIPLVDITGTTAIQVVARAEPGNQSDLVISIREAENNGAELGEFFSYTVPRSNFPSGGGFVTVTIDPTSGYNGDVRDGVLNGSLNDCGIQSPFQGTAAHRYTVQSIEFLGPEQDTIPDPGGDEECLPPVTLHGALSVSGTNIVDENGEVVRFAGNSMFWSNTGFGAEKYYTSEVVEWLQEDWKTTIVRAAMGVDEFGGYLSDRQGNLDRVTTIVDAAIANDMYVIIDWHSHYAENFESDAVDFFMQMATKYGDKPNVIYEIYNEPITRDWSNTIKPYSETVIAAIRAIDPDNLIIVGTPFYSQDVDVVSQDPITGFNNLAYTLHFYAGTHGSNLRNRARTAIRNGLPLMVTEWGTVNANGDGQVDVDSTEEWLTFMSDNNLTHLNWSIHDKVEGASALRSNASPQGGWSDSDLTTSGLYVREIVRDWHICVGENVAIPGDHNGDGVVTCADIDAYVGMMGMSAAGNEAYDLVDDGTIDLTDVAYLIENLVETSNGRTGTAVGDVNCDGRVDVLQDAFALIANLGATVDRYRDGDLNLDGTVSVLGDAFLMISNLGFSNDP